MRLSASDIQSLAVLGAVLGRHGDESYFGRWIYGQVMLQIRYRTVTDPLQIRYRSVTDPLQIRYRSVTDPLQIR